MKLDRRLLRLALSARKAFAVTLALGFAGGVLTILQARLLTSVINAVFLEKGILADVRGPLGFLILLVILRFGAAWAAEVSAHRVAAEAKETLRAQLLSHLFRLGPIPFSPAPSPLRESKDVRAETGSLINLLTEGIESLDAYFSQYLPQVFLAGLIPFAILLFVFPLDPLSGVVLLLTGPLIPLFMALIGSQANIQTQKQWQSLSRLAARFLDAIQGLVTLKLLGRSQAYAATLDQASEDHRQQTMSVLRVTFLSALALELLSTLSTAVVAVQIGLRLLYGYLSFEQAFFVLLLAPEFYLPLRLLGLRFHAGMAGATAGEQAFAILDTPTPPFPLSPAPSSPVIAFDHVSYTYPGGTPALCDASFELPPGQITALVGPSGAGKSTVAALLIGFISPSSGNIQSPFSNQHSAISYLPQRPYLFADTVAANLRMARPQATDDEVIAAAQWAHADEFIRQLPRGYDTLIGERGARLSGGQAQRIAIARACLQDAPLVIMDEPAAPLDSVSESLLNDALARLVDGRTVLVIAHRPQTIARAHQVIRLEAGRVVEIRKQSVDHPEMKLRATVSPPNANPPPSPDRPEIARRSISGLLQPTASQPNLSTESQTPCRLSLFSFLRPYASRIALSVLLGFAAIAAGIGLMTTSAYIIAAAALHPSVAELQVAIVGVRFFGLGRGVFRYLERLVSHDVTFRVLARLRGWFYRQIEPLVPLNDLHSGDLFARAMGDIATLENFYVRAVAPPLVAVLVSLGAAAFLGGFDPVLAAALLGFLLLGGVGAPLIIHVLSRVPSRQLISGRARLNVTLVDAIQGMADLLALGAVARQQERAATEAYGVAAAQRSLARLNGLQSALGLLLANAALIAVVVIAIPLVNTGRIEGVLLPVLALAALTSFEAVQPLPAAAQHLETNLQAADRLFSLAGQPPAVAEPSEPAPVPETFDLQINGLSFAYPDGTDSLQDVSFHLPPGAHIALVGPSGAGKTTLINLLLRVWEIPSPESRITLGFQDMRAFSPEALRQKIAVVAQNTYLFSATLRENLLLANPAASFEQIEQAVQTAHLGELVQSLPQGLDTWVGEHGLRFSGGERQRVAVARALLKDAPLILLDEPTAHLDPATERAVLAGIRKAAAGRSLLLATHRLVEMDWFDGILVLDGGQVAERGSHAELLTRNGLYCQMWEMQEK